MQQVNQGTDLNLRIKHTNYIITDADRTIKFYSEAFGMRLLQRIDVEALKLSLLFIGYGDIETTTTLELTYYWDVKPLQMGHSYKHICIGTNNIQEAFDCAVKSGATIVQAPYKPPYSPVETSFVQEPDGYMIEIMQDQ
jgi:lactoylglutathione lyase